MKSVLAALVWAALLASPADASSFIIGGSAVIKSATYPQVEQAAWRAAGGPDGAAAAGVGGVPARLSAAWPRALWRAAITRMDPAITDIVGWGTVIRMAPTAVAGVTHGDISAAPEEAVRGMTRRVGAATSAAGR